MIAATSTNHGRISSRMRQGFADLPTIHQQALYLTVVDGLPAQVVASRLDLPGEVVEQVAASARSKLYQAVAG
jgi:DNA-directed RNA polymerase specialized sigma24 family protein